MMRAITKTHLLVKSIQLDDSRCPRQDLQLISFRRSTPLCCADVAAVQGKSITSAHGAPTQAALCQFAFPGLLRQVEVDILEALPGGSSAFAHLGCTK
jgi:hypothetical protein